MINQAWLPQPSNVQEILQAAVVTYSTARTRRTRTGTVARHSLSRAPAFAALTLVKSLDTVGI